MATNYEEGLLELYKKIRPGEPLSVDSAESLVTAMFFDPRRYDLAKVGRYKFNKKLSFRNRLSGKVLAEDVVDPITGEVYEKGTQLTRELAEQIQNAAVPYVWIAAEERNVKILSNMMVDIRNGGVGSPLDTFKRVVHSFISKMPHFKNTVLQKFCPLQLFKLWIEMLDVNSKM